MTTIVYTDGYLITDSRALVKANIYNYLEEMDRHKGILLKNKDEKVVGVLAITGTQPIGKELDTAIECFSDRDYVNKLVADGEFGGTFTAILMYRDAVFAIAPKTDASQKNTINLVTGMQCIGSGGALAVIGLRLGHAKENIMAFVSQYDGFTSPNSYIIMQKELEPCL